MRKVDRHITPAVVIAGIALVGAAGWFVPQTSPPAAPDTGQVDARTTVVCATDPDDKREFELVAAGTADGQLRLTELGQPDDLDVLSEPGAAALKVETKPYGVVATGPMTTSSGSALLVGTGSGTDRGLSAQPCRSSGNDHWFAGVGAGGTQFSTVLVTNPDTQPAEVSIRFHGPEGLLSAIGASGIEVPPLSTRAIPLEGMLTDWPVDDVDDSLTVEVRTTAGRVEAVVHDRHQDGAETMGADWITPTAAPALSHVIPGIPGGAGDRILVVTNPGDSRAVVRVEALGADGSFVLDGAAEVDVPAGATVRVPLDEPLQGDDVGLRITADQPVVAGLNASSQDKDRAPDVTTPVAVPPINRSAILPIASAANVKGMIQLSNAADQPATAEIVLRDRSGEEIDRSTVEVAAGATAVVEVDDPALWAEIITEAEQVHAAVVLIGTRGRTAGLAWLPAISSPTGRALPPAVIDPRVGR